MGLRGPAIEPGRRTLPQVLRRVVKVQDTHSRGRELLLKQAPQPAAAITEPDHLRRPDDGLVARRLDPTPHRTPAHHAATVPAQQPRRRGKRHKDRERTAQELEFPTGPLLRLHPQDLIERGHLRDVTPVGTPSDASSPADRPDQARELAMGKALTAQQGPTGRAGGPGYRPLGTFGEHIFDDVSGPG